MLILALDTSGKSLSAALTRDGEIVGESTLSIGLRHSATALPMVHDLCERCGIAYPEIDLYACTTGPGSYTGIRIGISLIKGMAYAAKKPAVGISTLAALTRAMEPFSHEAIIVSMVDARSNRLFCSASGQGGILVPAGNRLQSELASELARILRDRPVGDRQLILTGDGAPAYANTTAWPEASSVRDAGPAFRWPRAMVIAELARQTYEAGGDFSPFLMEASYLSPSQAERMRQAHG